jgi:hypothetical protein
MKDYQIFLFVMPSGILEVYLALNGRYTVEINFGPRAAACSLVLAAIYSVADD